MTGCSMNKMANAPSDYLGKPQTAAKSANDAREALEDGKVGKAVGLAEQAVSASPRDGGYRALLGQRSEEHTSELQSLMRISYAVFCLKKKKTHNRRENEKRRRR